MFHLYKSTVLFIVESKPSTQLTVSFVVGRDINVGLLVLSCTTLSRDDSGAHVCSLFVYKDLYRVKLSAVL